MQSLPGRKFAIIWTRPASAHAAVRLACSVGVVACRNPGVDSATAGLALLVGEHSVALQVACGGGIGALRLLEGSLETEGGQRRLDADVVARELRVTLGQLPQDVRD